jgi:RND family efflux transporter MFP subunit
MHPWVLEDEPGPCPICGMAMVPVAGGTAEEGAAAAGRGTDGDREILFYRNPMDPTITSPVPMKDSMGMDYVPVYADEVAEAAAGPVVALDPGVVQNMNVVTAAVERRNVTNEIRTVGFLDYDQERMVTVTTKYPGFVETVYVHYVGESVRRGQPLFEIYAPELVQTQQELLSAIAFARRLEGAPEEARQRAEALVEAGRSRLAYWDIGEAQIERILESGTTQRTLTVTAPAGGVVMQRVPALEGMAVQPGMELFHIADLSYLWLSVEVFEDQLPWLREGSAAAIELSYFPGETFTGEVRFVEPQVSEATRTVGLRLEVPNPDRRLRAGMYATVRFAPVMAAETVAIPSLAVLRTGERNLVIVALGEGRFAPREVTLGAEGGGLVQVLSGLEAGERVVTSSQFLLDSESNLREAIQKLFASRTGGAEPEPPSPDQGHQH